MAEKPQNPESILTPEDYTGGNIDAEFAQMVEQMAVNGQLPEGVSLEQAMQFAAALKTVQNAEGTIDEAYENSETDSTPETPTELSLYEHIKQKFIPEVSPESEDKIDKDAMPILDALGSSIASTPNHDLTEVADDTKEMLGAKVIGAMVAGSETDNRFAKETLWELHTDSTDALDNVTYKALDSLLQLRDRILDQHIDSNGAELLLAEEVKHQVEQTTRGGGQGRDARLQIEAMAAQIARVVAPGSELHDHLILDARDTASKINSDTKGLAA